MSDHPDQSSFPSTSSSSSPSASFDYQAPEPTSSLDVSPSDGDESNSILLGALLANKRKLRNSGPTRERTLLDVIGGSGSRTIVEIDSAKTNGGGHVNKDEHDDDEASVKASCDSEGTPMQEVAEKGKEEEVLVEDRKDATSSEVATESNVANSRPSSRTMNDFSSMSLSGEGQGSGGSTRKPVEWPAARSDLVMGNPLYSWIEQELGLDEEEEEGGRDGDGDGAGERDGEEGEPEDVRKRKRRMEKEGKEKERKMDVDGESETSSSGSGDGNVVNNENQTENGNGRAGGGGDEEEDEDDESGLDKYRIRNEHSSNSGGGSGSGRGSFFGAAAGSALLSDATSGMETEKERKDKYREDDGDISEPFAGLTIFINGFLSKSVYTKFYSFCCRLL